MQIIIPMSGEGLRFKRAGFTIPKPLINVHGKAIIEHVINLFPGEKDFLFICRDEHIADYKIDSFLKSLKPDAKVLGIEAHKLGPVYAVKCAFDYIDDLEPALVSYCDYFMDWNWDDFKKIVKDNDCDGCVPVYTGFHPHLLPEKNLYAGVNTDNNGWIKEIREKFSFDEDKMQANHSPGIYYFKSGAILKKYFQTALDQDLSINNEFYASMPYNLLIKDGLKVYSYNKIPFFCQWGTPEDLNDYHYWYDLIKKTDNDIEILNFAKNYYPGYSIENLQKTMLYWKTFINNKSF